MKTITVTGEHKLDLPADVAEIYITLSSVGTTAASLPPLLQQTTIRLTEALNEIDVATPYNTGMKIDRERRQEQDQQLYYGSITLKVIAEISKAAVVFDVAAAAGAEVNVSYNLKDDRHVADELLKGAVADARHKALALAAGASLKLGTAVSVVADEGGMMAMRTAAYSAAVFEPATIVRSCRVRVTFEAQ